VAAARPAAARARVGAVELGVSVNIVSGVREAGALAASSSV